MRLPAQPQSTSQLDSLRAADITSREFAGDETLGMHRHPTFKESWHDHAKHANLPSSQNKTRSHNPCPTYVAHIRQRPTARIREPGLLDLPRTRSQGMTHWMRRQGVGVWPSKRRIDGDWRLQATAVRSAYLHDLQQDATPRPLALRRRPYVSPPDQMPKPILTAAESHFQTQAMLGIVMDSTQRVAYTKMGINKLLASRSAVW